MMRNLAAIAVLFIALNVSAQNPGGPTVGDPIAVDLDLRAGERIELEPLEGVDVVARIPEGVLVRAFRPGPVTLRFILTDERGASREIIREIEIASVLHADDDMEPAPLAPPVPTTANRTAWVSIAIAAVAATLIWLQLLWLPRNLSTGQPMGLSPGDEFRRVIERVRRMTPSDERFATLSDATRRFLSRVDLRLGRELTSAELIERLGEEFPETTIDEIRDILSEGDYAKFSPWGGRASRFDLVVEEASDLTSLDRQRRNT